MAPRTQTKRARVVFDEAHSEAWSVRPDVAVQMQAAHPADSSLQRASEALAERDFRIGVNTGELLTSATLSEADVLVIAHPSEPEWESTVGEGSPVLTQDEIDALTAWVEGGGGLIVLGETEQAKYGNNLNQLLAHFGVEIENCTVQDYEHHREAPTWIYADLVQAEVAGADPLTRVKEACFYRAGTLALANGARAIARTSADAAPPRAPLAAVVEHGAGRVVVLSDSDLFGDDCIGALDHEALWVNLAYWAAAPSFGRPAERPESEAANDPAWISLRDTVEELRGHQAADGSVPAEGRDDPRLRELTEGIAADAKALLPRFPHQAEYIEALAIDLADWVGGGFGRPDFIRSVEVYRPEQERRDGIEHLAVFPMYKQNGPPGTCFEALIVRVPWPEWAAELEQDYDNAKFVPVELVDFTTGYDSECAVLFPETFSTAERPPSYFGGIFCDREAERFRRICGSATEILRLNLPPDAACLLASEGLSRDAFIAWDLIHDRTHMRGDLPFDPFMIRQRSPYWMYSLEELRCDLTAFGEAVKLEGEGFALGRHVQYAILFDRLFRFPLTGGRVKNYDGLGGQLLFAYLHREGYLHWTDNRLVIDWDRLPEGVAGLRQLVGDLYHSGIDRSKLGQWIAAHDLVATYVPPAESSRWAKDRRDLPEVEEPKELVDLVRDDEFPLSLFYTQLAPKLEPAFDARPSRQSRDSKVTDGAVMA